MTTETLDAARERLRPYVERAKTLSGWDFSQIRIRRLSPDHPWDYLGRARQLVLAASSALDIGTGGGERYSEICADFSGRAFATEAWQPNVPVATARLRPLGIQLVHCEDEILPLAEASFDVVINRHAAWSANDLARILKPGGVFLTQQVDARSWKELRPFFPGRQFDWGHTFEDDIEGLKSAGFAITEASRSEALVAYEDLGDLVMNLIRTPWEIVDFDPLDRDLEALLALEKALMRAEGVVLTEARCLIEAKKPA